MGVPEQPRPRGPAVLGSDGSVVRHVLNVTTSRVLEDESGGENRQPEATRVAQPTFHLCDERVVHVGPDRAQDRGATQMGF